MSSLNMYMYVINHVSVVPSCDADPAALAKYVYALVKKDKPVEELRDVMVDQLDVFLQQGTCTTPYYP